jgi:RHS repeat-associated protein
LTGQQVLDPSIGLVPVDASNESLVTQNHYLYCGEQFDPDFGLYFLRARYMDTDRGRFWTMDVWEGVIQDPGSLHKYFYAKDNPIMYIDPSGKWTNLHTTFVLGIIGMIGTVSNLYHLNMYAEIRMQKQFRDIEQIAQGIVPADFYAPLRDVCKQAQTVARDEFMINYIYGPALDSLSAAFEAARLLGAARNIDEAMQLPGDIQRYSQVMSNLGYQWLPNKNNCYVGGNWVRPPNKRNVLPPPHEAYSVYKDIVEQASK